MSFSCDTLVVLAGKTQPRVSRMDELRPGMKVYTRQAGTDYTEEAVIKLIVKVECAEAPLLVKLTPSVTLAPWHPVFCAKIPSRPPRFPTFRAHDATQGGLHSVIHAWEFPIAVFDPVPVSTTPALYGLVLDTRAPVLLGMDEGCMGTVVAATLAHGCVAASDESEDALAHPYWGYEACVHDLAMHPGFDEGIVHLPRARYLRTNGKVSALLPPPVDY